MGKRFAELIANISRRSLGLVFVTALAIAGTGWVLWITDLIRFAPFIWLIMLLTSLSISLIPLLYYRNEEGDHDKKLFYLGSAVLLTVIFYFFAFHSTQNYSSNRFSVSMDNVNESIFSAEANLTQRNNELSGRVEVDIQQGYRIDIDDFSCLKRNRTKHGEFLEKRLVRATDHNVMFYVECKNRYSDFELDVQSAEELDLDVTFLGDLRIPKEKVKIEEGKLENYETSNKIFPPRKTEISIGKKVSEEVSFRVVPKYGSLEIFQSILLAFLTGLSVTFFSAWFVVDEREK